MDQSPARRFADSFNTLLVWVIFLAGLWLIVLQPLGPALELVPGDLSDARFNNYVLEHFFRWISGVHQDYWNATFFYPFPRVMAFSDNLFGSAPIYALLRWIGLDMASAYQGWYILGFCCNYAAAIYVLSRLKFRPLAAGMGAFFFTFGLPVLAQEVHAQLLYRFGVPFSCYFLWSFYQEPRLHKAVAALFWLVWQFYLTIYIGIFLSLLLAVLIILLPWFGQAAVVREYFMGWPARFRQAWSQATLMERVLALIGSSVLALVNAALLWPYFQVANLYGFSLKFEYVSRMLPRLESYLLADYAQLWRSIDAAVPMRSEHQLFPGVIILMLMVIGIAGRFSSEKSKMAWLYFVATMVLIAVTLYVNGFSFYQFLLRIPGVNSIRAITRIMLVLMWPISVFIVWVVDSLSARIEQNYRWAIVVVYLMAAALMMESIFYTHITYPKADAAARLTNLRLRIPAALPDSPILFAAGDISPGPIPLADLDTMLVAQELGWPTLNGYSGHFPPGYRQSNSCGQLPRRITAYMRFSGIADKSFYLNLINRVVPVGFHNCNPDWWNTMR